MTITYEGTDVRGVVKNTAVYDKQQYPPCYASGRTGY